MTSIFAGSRSIASSLALISSPDRKSNEKSPATRAPTRAAGSCWQSGCLAVVYALRQPPLAEGPAEIAGIGGEDDVTRGEAHSQRLMTRRMAVGGQADDAAVAEQIMLAVDLDHLVPEVEISPVEAAQCSAFGVHPGFPLAFLHDHDVSAIASQI
jgi:hypothetical protein